MKKKDIYFLVGVGMGFILTSIIFYIGLLLEPKENNYVEPSRDEIILLAREIGMIFPENDKSLETDNNIINNDTNTSNEDDKSEDLPFINIQPDETDASNDNTTEDIEQTDDMEDINSEDTYELNNEVGNAIETSSDNVIEEVEKITFTITPGESSNDVSRDLFKLGLIDEEKKFNDFLVKNNLDRVIRPKKYTVPINITESEIILLITGKNINYE